MGSKVSNKVKQVLGKWKLNRFSKDRDVNAIATRYPGCKVLSDENYFSFRLDLNALFDLEALIGDKHQLPETLVDNQAEVTYENGQIKFFVSRAALKSKNNYQSAEIWRPGEELIPDAG